MKKIKILFITLLMLLTLTACEKPEEEKELLPSECVGNPVYELFVEGYELRNFIWFKNYYATLYKDNKFLYVEGQVSDEMQSMLDKSIDNNDYITTLCYSKEAQTTDITDKFPEQDFLDTFMGKTIKDLGNRRYFVSGYYDENDEGTRILLSKDYLIFLATIDSIPIEDFYELSDEDKDALVIKKFIVFGFEENNEDNNNVFDGVEVPESSKQSPLYEYYINGFYENGCIWNDEKISLYLTNDKTYIYAVLPPSTEFNDRISNLDYDNYAQEAALLMCEMPSVEVYDITNIIPSQKELNKYIWGTVNDLVEDGYKYVSHTKFEEDNEVGYVTLSNDICDLSVTVECNLPSNAFNSLPSKEILLMDVLEVQFMNLNYEYNPINTQQ